MWLVGRQDVASEVCDEAKPYRFVFIPAVWRRSLMIGQFRFRLRLARRLVLPHHLTCMHETPVTFRDSDVYLTELNLLLAHAMLRGADQYPPFDFADCYP